MRAFSLSCDCYLTALNLRPTLHDTTMRKHNPFPIMHDCTHGNRRGAALPSTFWSRHRRRRSSKGPRWMCRAKVVSVAWFFGHPTEFFFEIFIFNLRDLFDCMRDFSVCICPCPVYCVFGHIEHVPPPVLALALCLTASPPLKVCWTTVVQPSALARRRSPTAMMSQTQGSAAMPLRHDHSLLFDCSFFSSLRQSGPLILIVLLNGGIYISSSSARCNFKIEIELRL